MSAIGYFKTPGIVWARPVYTLGYILAKAKLYPQLDFSSNKTFGSEIGI